MQRFLVVVATLVLSIALVACDDDMSDEDAISVDEWLDRAGPLDDELDSRMDQINRELFDRFEEELARPGPTFPEVPDDIRIKLPDELPLGEDEDCDDGEEEEEPEEGDEEEQEAPVFESEFGDLSDEALADVGQFLDEASGLHEDVLDSLRELPPPDENADEVEATIGLVQAGVDDTRDAAEAAADGDQDTMEDLLDDASEHFDEASDLAQEHGLQECVT